MKGEVYNCLNFKFKDGATKDKLLVFLNTPKNNENFLVLKTTSKVKTYPNQLGCHFKDNVHVIDPPFFKVRTWVQFDPNSVFEFTQNNILEMKLKHQQLEFLFKLQEADINGIINCFKKSDDISKYQKNLLH